MLKHMIISFFVLSVASVMFVNATQEDLYNFVKLNNNLEVGQKGKISSNSIEQNQQGEIFKRLTFFNDIANPQFTIRTNKAFWNLAKNKTLSIRIQNAMDWDITLYITIQDTSGQTLKALVALPAGPAQDLLIPLKATSSRIWGMRGGLTTTWHYEDTTYLLPKELKGKINTSQIANLSLSMDKPNVPQSILVGKVTANNIDAEKAAYYHLVDKYGQNSRLNWPEKVNTNKSLKEAAQNELKQLQIWSKDANSHNKYGGLGKISLFKATGFFTTAQKGKQWFLVTPDGYPFISLGVNAIEPDNSQTYIAGRKFMFNDLPANDSPLAKFYGYSDTRSGNAAAGGRGIAQGQWYDFYQANLFRIQPHDTLNYWCNLTINRLKAWGFNTIGNWSNSDLINQYQLPYTLPILIKGDYATVPSGMDWWGYMPDTFDSKFAEAVDKAIAKATNGHTNDPWLIGYFADNELSWGGLDHSKQTNYALAVNALKLSDTSPAKTAFINQLKSKYQSVDKLAKAWGITLSSWPIIAEKDFKAPLPDDNHPAIAKDYSNFLTAYADHYFKTVKESLSKYDNHHLFLGNRFAANIPEAISSCAKYCDVISFNMYTLLPKDGYDLALINHLNKPIMITEFSFGTKETGHLWAGPVDTVSEQARGIAYQNFIKAAFNDHHMVGVHWFQYIDQPITGRLLDGENGHLGLVSITNLPFQDFIRKAREINFKITQEMLEK